MKVFSTLFIVCCMYRTVLTETTTSTTHTPDTPATPAIPATPDTPATPAIPATPATVDSECPMKLAEHSGESRIRPHIDKRNIALLTLVGFSGFSLLVAVGYKQLRKYIFHDEHSLDTVFDAGGRVSLSLTAVTVTSQLLWPSDFAYISSLTSRTGIGGTLWMGVAVVVDILLFPALSIFLKTRAPGAKTFPQIAYARFGKVAHIMFCILALIINLIVTTSIMLAGKSVIAVLSKDSNNEFVFLILAVLFGCYCLIGGLGTTFYISYFNTALTFAAITVYTLYTSFYPSSEIERYSSLESVYNAITCLKGPDGNYEDSFMTFRTRSGYVYGVVVIFMATSTSFCDQANWQSRIAAKPAQGVLGFFFAAYMWFVIPTAISLTATLSYLTMSYENGTHLLTEQEINDAIEDDGGILGKDEDGGGLMGIYCRSEMHGDYSGYIMPFVMGHLMGDTGGYLLLTMIAMALMSTGSGEVMSISSIIVYDILKTYIYPFRPNLKPTDCILCGRPKQIDYLTDEITEYCACPAAINCDECRTDIERRYKSSDKIVLHYRCGIHGEYRHYEDRLWDYKTWCMVCVVACIVPYGLVISDSGINVTWATVAVPVIGTPFLLPLLLTITWSKATSKGVVSGAVVGLVFSISGMLIVGSTYEGGLGKFWTNTAQDYSLLAGMLAGFGVSGLLCVVVSLCTHNIQSEDDTQREWAKTVNIDNPLSPFRLIYEQELADIGAGSVITANTMDQIFHKAKKVAWIGAGINLFIFLVVIPSVAISQGVLTFEQFKTWIRLFQFCVMIGTVLVIVVPPFEEAAQIWRKYKENVRDKAKSYIKEANNGHGKHASNNVTTRL